MTVSDLLEQPCNKSDNINKVVMYQIKHEQPIFIWYTNSSRNLYFHESIFTERCAICTDKFLLVISLLLFLNLCMLTLPNELHTVTIIRNITCIWHITSSFHTAITQVELTLGTMKGNVVQWRNKTSWTSITTPSAVKSRIHEVGIRFIQYMSWMKCRSVWLDTVVTKIKLTWRAVCWKTKAIQTYIFKGL
jgi:hypothetical protein